MPFPLAHPAAVLPLGRWCPKHLSFSALIMGSLIPDMMNWLNWDNFTHSFIGSLTFCWLFAAISLWVFYRVRAPLVATLPNPHRQALLPLCGRPCGTILVCAISLLVGIWIHIGWDLLTQDHRWLGQRLGAVELPLPSLGTYQMRVSRILWIGSSVGGIALVVGAYLAWLQRLKKSNALFAASQWRAYLTWLIFLLIPAAAGAALTMLVWWGHSLGFLIRAFTEFYIFLLHLTLAMAGYLLLKRRR